MSAIRINSGILRQKLIESGLLSARGSIKIDLNGISVTVKSTDTIGNILQEWLTEWMSVNNIYYRPSDNTQAFPDFYLSEDSTTNLLEIKSYIASRRPAFDVANFDSYWNSLRTHPERLDASYLIFAYELVDGVLQIVEIYDKKVWEITGPAKEYKLNCQRKKGQIYNIRPNSFASKSSNIIGVFENKSEYVAALYHTIVQSTNKVKDTRAWLYDVTTGYKSLTGVDLLPQVEGYIESR